MNGHAPNDEPQVDDAVWDAWVRKNEAKDKIRFVRRKKILGVFVALGIILALFWRFSP
jgi:hypothetical protein